MRRIASRWLASARVLRCACFAAEFTQKCWSATTSRNLSAAVPGTGGVCERLEICAEEPDRRARATLYVFVQEVPRRGQHRVSHHCPRICRAATRPTRSLLRASRQAGESKGCSVPSHRLGQFFARRSLGLHAYDSPISL